MKNLEFRSEIASGSSIYQQYCGRSLAMDVAWSEWM